MPIHPAAEGFDHSASDYERGRPNYPPAAVNWLVAQLGIGRQQVLVDLAAGTGKLTRLLLASGARVTAVEPVAGMRRTLAAALSGVEVVDGTAESMPLPDAVADAVTVGQAFHWFRASQALAEIHRVLRPGGGLGLVWNRRDLAQPLQAALHDVVDRYRGDTPSHASVDWRRSLSTSSLFGPIVEAHFPMEQELDADGLVARGLSISFIALLPEATRGAVAAELRRIADEATGPLVLRYVTEVTCCRAR